MGQGIRITGGATGMDSTVLVIAYFRGGGDPDSYASVAEQGSKVRKWRPLATTPAACYEKRPSCGSVTHEKRECPSKSCSMAGGALPPPKVRLISLLLLLARLCLFRLGLPYDGKSERLAIKYLICVVAYPSVLDD